MIAAWRRFRTLQPTDRRLVLEAASLMVVVWSGFRVLRFSRVLELVARHANRPPGDARPALDRIAWAVTAAAGRLPLPTTCLVRALVADAMIRRHGGRSELRIGVLQNGGDASPLEAHAWVECGGEVIVGGLDNLEDYAVLSGSGR